jgi:ATP/maltotriose-dependent transcriptional regulator MalT
MQTSGAHGSGWPVSGLVHSVGVAQRGWEPVLTLMAKGRSDEQIADALDMGLRTVRRRIAEAMDELGARSRFELGAAWARWRDGGRIA